MEWSKILVVVFLNIISAWTFGRVMMMTIRPKTVKKWRKTKKVYVFIGEIMNPPSKFFSKMERLLDNNSEFYYYDYSCFGFNLNIYSDIIYKDVLEMVKNGKKVTIVSAFIGDQIVAKMGVFKENVNYVTVNPCTYWSFFKKRSGLVIFAIEVFRFLVLLLGWLSFMPIIPSKNGKCVSLKLFSDGLLSFKLNGSGRSKFNKLNRKIIITEDGSCLNAVIIKSIFSKSSFYDLDKNDFRREDSLIAEMARIIAKA